MVRVVGIDHISIRVSDFEKSKVFYSRLMEFLGFEIEAEYPRAMGWKNGHTLFWIGGEGGRPPKPTTSATSACITTPSGYAAAKTSTTWMFSCATT